MHLHFDYQMKLFYSAPVNVCNYTIKCIPKNTMRQRLLQRNIEFIPETKYSLGEDSYGNQMLYGRIDKPHDLLIFRITGEVETHPTEYEDIAYTSRIGMYKYPFGKCIPGEALLAYFKSLKLSDCHNAPDICSQVMQKLYADFSYVPAKTNTGTDAEEAWKLRMGVCQDYAHIYITLLRLFGIPARYVCGFLTGEGASHAWVEALYNGRWYGFDPTNNCAVNEGYIKLGDGRDATECAINRGIMLGGGTQTQEITAMVTQQ